MAIPASLQKGLKLPVIEAPMFLVSGPDLVVECCRHVSSVRGCRRRERRIRLRRTTLPACG